MRRIFKRSTLAWRIVCATANDNRVNARFWLRYLIPWSLLTGSLLAWHFFK